MVKAIAARVLDLPVHDTVVLLSGQALADEGIIGGVEADFFDWPLKRPAGAELVRHAALQTARFRLREVEADVLKVLYESLVDPDQRHDLGEYYTPDWLASRIVTAAMEAPLEERVLDPACGSGTFLFHALRRLIAAARAAGWPGARILEACQENVRGLDVHPVAVTLARVTWLLALVTLTHERQAKLTVPVFLGDALQWNLRRYVDGADVLVEVPGDTPLQIPAGFAEDQAVFEQGLDALHQGIADGATPEAVAQALRRIEGATSADADALAVTFAHLQTLYRGGKNGIWTFVLRNLVRPVWLSRPEQRADVLIGNPPWTVYRHLSPGMKDRLREALQQYDLWVGGHLATQQDMCALFWARGAERYLREGGRIAFVLPYAALNAPVFAGLREGRLGSQVEVRLTGGWSLERVWPIFGAQSGSSTTSTCVLFGRRERAGAHPAEVDRWEGRLPRRDVGDAQATQALTHSRAPWPRARTLAGASPYRARFRQGATIVPRRFFIVEAEPESRLGSRRDAPRGRVGALDKEPWKSVAPPHGPVESEFLRQLVLGETIAPFRLFEPVTAVVPMRGTSVLDSAAAGAGGFRYLAAWLRDAEAKWVTHCNKDAHGQPRMTLLARIDHMRNLSCQAGQNGVRILYTKAGTRLRAARISASDGLIDHKAYWAPARSPEEAGYLIAVINSSAALGRIADLQPHGEAGTRRDFDNLVWTLPIPEYDDTERLHRDLAAAASRAEEVAAAVEFARSPHFVAKRHAIRAALAADGVAAEIEAMVDALLPP